MRIISYRAEREVIRPQNPGVHPDDWPIFELQDAIVYSHDGEVFTNLLEVEYEGPFTLRGKVIVEEDQKADRRFRATLLAVPGWIRSY